MKQKEQTAVEWLAFQIMDNWNDITAGSRNIDDFIEQAKEMEKQQRKQSYDNGYANGQLDLITE